MIAHHSVPSVCPGTWHTVGTPYLISVMAEQAFVLRTLILKPVIGSLHQERKVNTKHTKQMCEKIDFIMN